jgi:hypothetical protein
MTILVIDHDPTWSDAERKKKEKFWMHRLKSSSLRASTNLLTSPG